MRFTYLLKQNEKTTNTNNSPTILNIINNNRFLTMKYIPTIIIILMLSFLIGLVIGISGKISTVSNTEPLKQIIFKYDADLDQCVIDRDNYKYTVDKMAETCN